MKQLALYTFGILHESRAHPRSRGFVDRLDSVYATAERSPGFVDRSRRHPQTYEASWQPWAAPRFIAPSELDRIAASLSLWRDLESAFLFAYHGAHDEALGHRRDWFEPPRWPSYVVWWVDGRPDFVDASARIEKLHDEGPSPAAFTFKSAFDPAGAPYRLDGARVEALRHPREERTPT